MDDTMKNRLQFWAQTDAMKNVLRQTLIADGSRRENDAEHSWHLALGAMLFYEYAEPGVDLGRVLQMAAVHDLVEVYAGDTFAYDIAGNETKAAREAEAAQRLFGMLPAEQGAHYRALWEEFDAMETPDSRYAAAIDRLQPFMLNAVTKGQTTWEKHHVERAQVYERMDMVRQATPALWPYVEQVVADAIQRGLIRE